MFACRFNYDVSTLHDIMRCNCRRVMLCGGIFDTPTHELAEFACTSNYDGLFTLPSRECMREHSFVIESNRGFLPASHEPVIFLMYK